MNPGTPDPCNLPWQPDPDDASLCVLGQPACPEHPLQPGSYLLPSTEFPDFCEAEVVLDPLDPPPYTACVALTGYVIKMFVRGTDQVCRMIRPTQCALNMHRTETDWCERAQRRNWTCASGTTPTNRFNTCYQQPPDYAGPLHPACGTGAPNFAISSCEDYVSQDFVRVPASVPCNSFATGDTRSALRNLASPPNLYWCQFDSSYLDVGCYSTGPPCPAADAVCIKRASTTGGCYAMANALRCRKLQAEYLDGSRTAEDVYGEGCAPCVALPFSPTPPDCPRDLRANPTLSTSVRLEDTHQRRSDRGPSASSRSFCTDPPRGRLVWESSHHVGQAIVNSPVVLRVVDIPVTTRTFRHITVTGTNRGADHVRFWRTVRQHFEYPGSAPSDPIVRTWPTFDDTLAFRDVDRIVGAVRASPGSSTFFNSGPCLIRILPDFRVRVEELWPDNDAADIRALFGSDALEWWEDLNPMGLDPTLQRERTEARGLNYVGGMNATELAAELARRADSLTQEVRCNYGTDVWCNWRPPRPGYYRLVAAGAWYMTKLSGNRRWQQPQWLGPVNTALMDMYVDRDTDCPPRHSSVRYHSDHDCLLLDLAWMNATPAEAGLLPDLSGLLPVGSNAEWLYTAAAGPNVRCPPRDLRVGCAGGAESSNYTESEPIGIVVHEVRVSTVAPDS